ncbi:TolC family type I secretion outer membrane protein [Candidatus Bartonella washoeensis Sb944nv]|uniref:TolC family type I secretion outer membrane protein n=1 Tax=Candidatus Bartonella washoeensis Sb944nv TaxID=1094563 RepID=J0PWV7_9HYPH|nr:TolC family outer membrane protein [Bartonella washoeensis]EJF77136.1 TolC family type I secretion outer membrane protein [Bartonella washoeensis Sb944nv]
MITLGFSIVCIVFKINKKFQVCLFLALSVFLSGAVCAETLMDAFAKAYVYNAKLNSERAAVRISGDDVVIARSGLLPQIEGVGSYGRNKSIAGPYNTSGSLGIRLNQRLFDGFITQNIFFSAQVKLQAQREYLRNAEQNMFLDTVKAYADLYQARRIADLRRENLAALEEQVRSNKAKLDVGEGGRVDFAQAQAARSVAVSELSLARADVKSAEAVYRQIVGSDPEKLKRPRLAGGLPVNLNAAYQISVALHPAILYAKYLVDASFYNVKAKEGALLPKIDFSASASYNRIYSGPGEDGVSKSIGLSLSVPIFEGGRTSAQIRQSKEQLGQAHLQLDLAHSNTRQALTSVWFQLEGARSSVVAYRDSVRAAEIALKGRVQENRVGQATTLDVLNSRTQLINAQIALAMAERNAVVASYGVQSAIGKLTANYLGLKTVKYN